MTEKLKQLTHIIAACIVIAHLLWLTVMEAEPRLANTHEILARSIMCIMVLTVPLQLITKVPKLQLGRIDILLMVWLLYFIGRVWISGKDCCDTIFLKTTEIGLLYIALRGFFSCIRLSASIIIYSLILCGIYESGLGLWQMVNGLSKYDSHFLIGSFQNPGPYSAYLLITGVIGLCCIHKIKGIKFKTVIAWLTYFILFLLPATLSRAAIISFVLIVLWLYREKYWKYRWMIWTSILVLFILSYLAKQGSANGRLLTWAASITAWCNHPWVGYGIGGFRAACANGISTMYNNNPTSWIFESGGVAEYAFNDFIKVIVEQGLIGGILCIATAILLLRKLHKQSRPLFFGLLSLFIFSLFSYPFELLSYQIILVLVSAFATSNTDKEYETTCHRPWRAVVMLLFLPIALFITKEIERRHEADIIAKKITGIHHASFINEYYKLMPVEMDNASFLFDFGKTLREAKRYNDSNAMLRQGTMVSNDPMFWVMIGNNYRDMLCYREAEDAYQKAFSIMPNRLYPLYQLMMMKEEMGETESMQIIAETIMKLHPKIKSSATESMVDSARKRVKPINDIIK